MTEVIIDKTELEIPNKVENDITSKLESLNVKKRNGRVVSFDANLITNAVLKAFKAVYGSGADDSTSFNNIASMVTNNVVKEIVDQPLNIPVDIEKIQNLVEQQLMLNQVPDVAKAYILYRHSQEQKRQSETVDHTVTIKDEKDNPYKLSISHIQSMLDGVSDGLDVDTTRLAKDIFANLYENAPYEDFLKSRIMCARTRIETNPDYSYLCARILKEDLFDMSVRCLGLSHDATYEQVFVSGIRFGVEKELMNPELLGFDLDRLADHLDQAKDNIFNFLGLQTLFDRYFIHWKLERFELPQAFFMRIAMGLALNEQNKNDKAIEFYNLLSSHTFMSSTPTLFNSGTLRSQLSSCYLTTVSDDLDGIYSAIKDNANLSKYAGGLGNDWTNVRGCGSHIKGTNGMSSGVIPFLNVADATAVAVNQGGKRKGAVCAYLETWHLDIEEFLELRKNTGDDRRRTHDMNTANWVPDLFMERVHNKEDWTLFSPADAPDLHGLYGTAFKERYEAYESLAKEDKIPHRVIPAVQLWRKMLSMIFETGHPWMTFKDPCNLRSPQQHAGVVNSSNLCTEITLNTSKEEIAVCNLGSINLSKHFKDGKLDKAKLRSTIDVAIRMLDNVIDINYYAVDTARNSNMKHRPIGMGLMGFQDALYIQGIAYDSQEAIEFADYCMELISYYAILASSKLAQERGVYESYKGSLWDQGILPVDSVKLLKDTRPSHLVCDQDQDTSLDWDVVRQEVANHGVRNSNIMAIAPTATIANICGVSQSIEPTYQNLFVKSNLSGEFTMINEYLIRALKKEGLWDEAMVNDLKYYNGDLTGIQRVPESIKAVFKTAFQIEPQWLIDCASKRQKWIDQAQSLNLYINQPSGKKLDQIYKYAWMKGLKTTYYLRSLGASAPERATVTDGQLNAVPKQCSIDDPDCEACQ